MDSIHTCPGEYCSTLGVDAVSLDAFADVDTDEGELIIFDEETEEAWVQSDSYASRDVMT